MNAQFQCSILTSPTEVEALREEWQVLHSRAGRGPFTDYDWFAIWWQTMGIIEGRTLHIITGRIDQKLVALLPLVVTPKKGFRVLQAAGAESFYLCDMLCEDPAYADTLWQTARQSNQYDFAHIRDTFPNSDCERVLSSFARLHDKNKMLYLRSEWSSAQEWKATFSKQFRRNLDKARRLLEEKGPVSYEMREGKPVPPDVIEGMVEHKTLWCNSFDKRGMFDQPKVLPYYQQLTKTTAERGYLVMAWLKCGEAVIAYHMMFRYEKTLYSLVMATNAEWLKYSPGHLAHVNAMSWALENGFTEFNHMQGDYAYKYQFSNGAYECREYTFCRSIKGWIGEHIFIKKRALKRRIAPERAG